MTLEVLATTTFTYDAAGNQRTITTPRGNEAGATAANYQTTYVYDAINRLQSVSQPVWDGSPPGAESAADTFSTVSYANNDGSVPWGGDWTESGDSSGATGGDIAIVADLGDNRLRLRNKNNSVSRAVDLGAATTATLSFDYRRVGLDNSGDYVAVEVMGNGESWTELTGGRFAGPTNDGSYLPASYDISAYAATDTAIRFVTSSSLGKQDRVHIDNVTIDYDTPATLPIPDIVTEYGYDAAGNLTRFTDGRLNPTIYTYTPWNLRETVVEPATTQHPAAADRTWTMLYDAGGLAREERQPGGVTITRDFDELGRMTTEDGTGGGLATASRDLGYDLTGLLTSAGPLGNTLDFVYDDRGLLDLVSGPAGDTDYGYDPRGLLASRTDPAGAAAFTWTPRRGLDTVTDPVSGVNLDYGYDLANQPDTVTYSSGLLRTYGFDDLGRLTTDVLTDAAQTTTYTDYSYGYDPDGNLTEKTVDVGGVNSEEGPHSYDYDFAGRLREWTSPTSGLTTYGWDASGNRESAGADSYDYDARNRLTSGPQGAYSYHARGDLVDIAGTAYGFDALGRLADYGGTVSYTYDALDRVATRDDTPGVPGDAVPFTYSGMSLDPATDGAFTYFRSPGGRLLSLTDGTTSSLAGLDRHGDLNYLFSGSGVVSDTSLYDPFGDVAASTGTTNATVGFQSDYTDPSSGEVWMGARWYSGADAVFRSRDSVFGELATPVSLNRYTYAWASPLNFWDPDGRLCAKALETGSCSTRGQTESRQSKAATYTTLTTTGISPEAGRALRQRNSERSTGVALAKAKAENARPEPEASSTEAWVSTSVAVGLDLEVAAILTQLSSNGSIGPQSLSIRPASTSIMEIPITLDNLALIEQLREAGAMTCGLETCSVHIWHDQAKGVLAETVANGLSSAADFTPGLGDLKGLAEVFTGTDVGTGDDLGWTRWLGIFGASEFRHINKAVRGFDRFNAAGRQIRVSDERLQHVVDNHTVWGRHAAAEAGAKSGPKSIFDEGTDLRALIRNVDTHPIEQTSGNLAYVMRAEDVVGVDRLTHQWTDVYTVITDQDGGLITLFPGLPGGP